MSERQKQIRQWWGHKSTIYPFHAEGPGDPARIFDATGLNFISVGLKPDDGALRTWGFLTAEDRAKCLSLNPELKEI